MAGKAAPSSGVVGRNRSSRPIFELPGMRFGHAGTIVEGRADTAAEKVRRLTEAGIAVAEEIADIPKLVKERLKGAA